jgi:hypothetical protein
MKNNIKNKKENIIRKVIILFLLYSFIYITILLFIDYYAYDMFNPYLLTIISILLGAISTYIHLKKGKRTQIDIFEEKI